MKYKALVIGCGNIGAEYDLHNKEVQTHVKAMYLRKDIDLVVADLDSAKAARIAGHYNVGFLQEITQRNMQGFDMVSVCVSTPYHYEYLAALAAIRTPLIICEKPVVNSLEAIQQLRRLPNGKILVNYIRRFQPGFHLLKKRLEAILQSDSLKSVHIRYQRGFLNNCSHALDLLEFLFASRLDLKTLHVTEASFDAFSDDPTISGTMKQDGYTIFLNGFVQHHFSIFEIDIYTADWHIEITNSGNNIVYYNTREGKSNKLTPVNRLGQTDVLSNYMTPVIAHAVQILKHNKSDNFEDALNLNERVLKAIKKIK